jgi:hypothetical protein
MGLAFRVLFETSHSGAIEIEIHLPQMLLRSSSNREEPLVESYVFNSVDKRLSPDGNQCFFEAHLKPPFLSLPRRNEFQTLAAVWA